MHFSKLVILVSAGLAAATTSGNDLYAREPAAVADDAPEPTQPPSTLLARDIVDDAKSWAQDKASDVSSFLTDQAGDIKSWAKDKADDASTLIEGHASHVSTALRSAIDSAETRINDNDNDNTASSIGGQASLVAVVFAISSTVFGLLLV